MIQATLKHTIKKLIFPITNYHLEIIFTLAVHIISRSES
ncbi:hypothetical protein C4K37_3788 [Pseudomonas chlororaphis subsp. piscium]|uniref:Uncharacterized protein n=1 Tax=Pseudomonas chlororaphis TaxID=587753 RepID=A0AAX3FR88_9PSED|nr:hypothetical protein C4K37_3788 [Pseudomonas chlororaphis subsp. piscium]AZC44719.1 hypothetical protein C4K36_3796 [Pseudomonas chlororaphis subsp. piscium]VEF72671.1 Uncharacterised protein [Pseudomonas chlororaphis]